MHGLDERLVQRAPLLPQRVRVGILERLARHLRVHLRQQAARKVRAFLSQPAHDVKREAVHRIPLRVGALVERLEQSLIPARVEHLDLDEYLEAGPDRVERLRQGRHRLAVAQPHDVEIARARLGDRDAADAGVVMNDQLAVGRRVNVELDAVRAGRSGGAERGERILQLAAGGAAMRDDERPHCCSLSAFFASIQPGSFSMSCTTAISSGRGSMPSR